MSHEGVLSSRQTPYVIGDSSEISAAMMGCVIKVFTVRHSLSSEFFKRKKSLIPIRWRYQTWSTWIGSLPQNDRTFFEHESLKPVEKWQKVANQNDRYVIIKKKVVDTTFNTKKFCIIHLGKIARACRHEIRWTKSASQRPRSFATLAEAKRTNRRCDKCVHASVRPSRHYAIRRCNCQLAANSSVNFLDAVVLDQAHSGCHYTLFHAVRSSNNERTT